ncbi:MAG: hypothetical protein LBT08_06240 [Synergistaceae bacterium]|nr:hypothetical protein [Synergistaceae bacterium]
MSEPSALFAKICMSEGACRKWLASPIKYISDYDDWPMMNPTAARNHGDWTGRPVGDFMSVQEFLDSIADESRYFCCEYDDELGAFFIADAKYRSSMAEIASGISALRGAESFKDDDEPSFIYIFPAMSGGDPEALLEVKRGRSGFLPPNDKSPEVLYFANEAEEFIEELLGDDDE